MAPLTPSPSLLELLASSLRALHSPLPTDAILRCPHSALSLLPTCPAALIKLSDSKIHSFSYNEVPVCWRRLYTDASIAKAIRIIRSAFQREQAGGEGGDKGERKWIQEVVELLDMAIIMAGAPERQVMIENLFSALQNYTMPDEDREDARPRKKQRLDCHDTFPDIHASKVPVISYPIPKRSNLSMAEFANHLPSAQPLVIRNALAYWPAVGERPWKSPMYLLRQTLDGRRLVPVELGRSYTDEGWGQSIITFKEFMNRYMLQPTADKGTEDRGEIEDGIGYLAQHDIFAQIPSLRNDISIPDFCYTDPPPPGSETVLGRKRQQPKKLEDPLLNAWFGPAGTVSPLHTDPYHNILCQVVGKKYVRLYSPSETAKLYPKRSEDGGVDMSNTSEVDVESNESEREKMYPLFREAQYVETVLEEGESLYVPVGWWHYIRSLNVSFSVSFWWN